LEKPILKNMNGIGKIQSKREKATELEKMEYLNREMIEPIRDILNTPDGGTSRDDLVALVKKDFFIKPRGYERYLWFNPRQLSITDIKVKVV
jgi:hypothetical protein